MHSLEIKPDKLAYLSVLKAFMNVAALEAGRGIHKEIVDNGFQVDIFLGSTLVDMYAKYGNLKEAYNVFENLPRRDIIMWAIIIAGYANQGKGYEAIECFDGMQNQGIKPSKVIFLDALKACSNIGSLIQGRFIHEQMIDNVFLSDIAIGSTLIVMYTKAGSLKEALKVFSNLARQDVVSWSAIVVVWSAMIIGCAQIGDAGLAAECFKSMKNHGTQPNDVAFLGILTTLNRVGMADEGLWYARSMSEFDCLNFNLLHITCMVELLSHAGCFKEAEDSITVKSDICLWVSLLTTCKMHY